MWADFGLAFNHLKADLRDLTGKVPCHEVQRVSHQQQTAGGPIKTEPSKKLAEALLGRQDAE